MFKPSDPKSDEFMGIENIEEADTVTIAVSWKWMIADDKFTSAKKQQKNFLFKLLYVEYSKTKWQTL